VCAQPQHHRTLLRKHDPSEERVVVRVGDHTVDVDRLAAEHGFANLGEMLTVPSIALTETHTHTRTHITDTVLEGHFVWQTHEGGSKRGSIDAHAERIASHVDW
jgi:hypothetical protein